MIEQRAVTVIVNGLPGAGKTTLARLAGLKRAGVDPQAVHEVWCDVPVSVARARYTARASQRHAIHPESDGRTDGEWEIWERNAEPLGMGAVHRVDTSVHVDIDALATQIRTGR